MSRYKIPKGRTRVETRVSNSRFIATVDAASSVKQAQDTIRDIRREMPDATHHVYAFKIGHGASVSEGVSDDGEPSGTSGPPVMAVLRGTQLGDVVIVVTRYFGGTKLGTGGLVAAYSQAAKAVFDAVQTEVKVIRAPYRLKLPYAVYDQVRRLLTEYDCTLEHEDFTADVDLRLGVPEDAVLPFTEAVCELTAGRIAPIRIEMPD